MEKLNHLSSELNELLEETETNLADLRYLLSYLKSVNISTHLAVRRIKLFEELQKKLGETTVSAREVNTLAKEKQELEKMLVTLKKERETLEKEKERMLREQEELKAERERLLRQIEESKQREELFDAEREELKTQFELLKASLIQSSEEEKEEKKEEKKEEEDTSIKLAQLDLILQHVLTKVENETLKELLEDIRQLVSTKEISPDSEDRLEKKAKQIEEILETPPQEVSASGWRKPLKTTEEPEVEAKAREGLAKKEETTEEPEVEAKAREGLAKKEETTEEPKAESPAQVKEKSPVVEPEAEEVDEKTKKVLELFIEYLQEADSDKSFQLRIAAICDMDEAYETLGSIGLSQIYSYRTKKLSSRDEVVELLQTWIKTGVPR